MFIDRVMDICDRIMRQTADQKPAESNGPVVSPELQRDSNLATVLLVEDEPTLLQGLRSALEHSGYKVLSAESGESALRISQNHSGTIDVLISDVVLGGVNGFEVARAVTSDHPKAIVILMSGSPLHAFPPPATAHCFLQKPFDHEQLLKAITRSAAALQPAAVELCRTNHEGKEKSKSTVK